MDLPKCQKCNNGMLIPLSDYGQEGASVIFKAWACTNPECGFSLRVDKGEVSYGKRIEHNDAGAQFRNAGIFHLAVNKDQAFLADIGVKAAESNREIGIVFRPDAHQAVQDGLAVLEFHIELIVMAFVLARPAPDFQAD